MSKATSILKKTLKAILWIALIFMLLFIIVAALIQIPAVQNKIVQTATTFISSKTHTKVEIKNVSISFPKSVVIEGLYLEDLKKDTLVYAREAKINIVFYDILFNKITVNSISLDGLNLKLYNTKTDSLFNYNFLLTAFKDSTNQTKVNPKTPSVWTFSLDRVSLKNIRVHYNDAFGGMNVSAAFKKFELKMDKMDLDRVIFNIDDLLVENLTANVLITLSPNPKGKKSTSILPTVTANNIQINNSTITYGDSIGRQSALAVIKRFEIKKGSVDLQNDLVSLDNIYLTESEIGYTTSEPKTTSGQTVAATETIGNDWKVTVKNIKMDENSLTYNVSNTPVLKNAFDANHMYFKYFSVAARDINYSSVKTAATILKFNAIDKNKFIITGFSTDFSMDEHSITARKLKVSTTNSSIDGDVNIQYTSLKSMKESLPLLVLNIDLKKLSFRNSDILYFNPALFKQSFFKNKNNLTTISGIVKGAVNKLNGKNLVVRTGVNTVLKTNFNIAGLPNVQKAYYDFPNLTIVSGKQDIEMMAGSSIPKSIALPENINMKIVFKGKMKAFVSTMDMNSSFGSGRLFATIDQTENFKGNLNIPTFDLGSLMKDKAMYGPVSLKAEVNGHGFDPKTITADIKAQISQIYLNKYTYHNLNVDGIVNGREFAGKVNLNDKNAVFDFDGLVNLNPNKEQYKFNLNVSGADLQKLNFSKDDLRISLVASADLKGGTMNNLNGKAGINKMIIAHLGKKYRLDSLLVTSINEPNRSEMNISSALIGIKYSGTVSPVALPEMLSQFFQPYFPFSDAKPLKKASEPASFTFDIQLHNHPILSEVFFPQLKEFEPGIIHGSFDSQTHKLLLNGNMNKIVYGTTEIDNLAMDVNSDATALNYKISSSNITNSQIRLVNFLFDGKLADHKMSVNISSIENLNKKLLIRAEITKDKTNYELRLDPKNFYLMNNRWDIAADNQIEFGQKGFLIHHLFMNHAASQVNITSVHDHFNDDLSVAIKNFKLDDISQIVKKDSSLLKGNVDGNVLLKRVNNSYGIIADARITDLVVRSVPIGNLVVKADNPTAEKFNIDMKLTGVDNNLTATGYFIPNGGNNSLNIKTAIHSLSMKTLQAFSMGQLTQASGKMTGDLLIGGRTDAPEVTGQLIFDNAFITPAMLNNRLELKHETVQLKPDGIYFSSFTLLDPNQHAAVIDGSVQMKQFTDFIFGLHVNTKDFLLFNTTATKDNNEFYGRMIIDSKVDITGPMSLPVINARLKMKKGSNFTFAVPEDELTTDKGENVVEFEDTLKLNSILYRAETKIQPKAGFKGFDLSSIIEVDKEATLRLLMDPTSTDSLVVRGEAALSFTMDKSGKRSLTGAYNLNQGSYLVSLESVIKRKFDIIPGSTIIWNGDPLDAIISINATYSVRATPIDLVANQMASLSDADKAGYKQPYPFLVVLKLRGAILKPEISFEIQLPPEDKGVLGGAVNQKLNILNEDPSALNKQVFALLVLGRFVQENPLQTESGGTASLVRSTVGNFLSAQLNKLSSKVLPGVEMNFDIQSYNDYQSGQAQGRTQVEIGLKKQLFNERLSVEVGGKVDVEGAAAKQNSVSDIASDVTIEYKLAKDGSYRLKGFRHNQYEGAIEGQLVETGAGIVYVHDFNKWKQLFKKSGTVKKPSIKGTKNDTIRTK